METSDQGEPAVAVPRSLRDKHAEDTRRALVRSARTLFARNGFEATGVDQIAAHAGATRGAVYHHFKGKRELLLAVLDEMLAALATRVVEAAGREPDPVRRMRIAVLAFLDTCTEPAYARVVLEEAPAVLGWDTWREIDDRHFLGMTRSSVEELIGAGLLADVDAGTLAHLLMATWTEAALLLSRDASAEVRTRVVAAVDAVLGGLMGSLEAADLRR